MTGEDGETENAQFERSWKGAVERAGRRSQWHITSTYLITLPNPGIIRGGSFMPRTISDRAQHGLLSWERNGRNGVGG